MGVVLLPFELIIALVIELTSPGPIIYSQERTAKMPILSWFINSETSANRRRKTWRTVVIRVNDARVTPFGKFLRASHLDELPQLWNILRGDISFIAPGPKGRIRRQIEIQELPYYEIRLLIKPGLDRWARSTIAPTAIWATSAKNCNTTSII